MKFFLNAIKDLLVELVFACLAIPILIVCIVVYELADPIVRFCDKMATRNQKPVKNIKSTW